MSSSQRLRSSWTPRRLFAVVLMLSVVVFALIFSVPFFTGFDSNASHDDFKSYSTDKFISTTRKLLARVEEPNRIWGERCTNADIVINQGPTAPLPSGIPTYTVEIMNVCVSGCDISKIHLNCGWFSSARLVNPKVFKRLRFGDCLVNDGKALVNGGTLSFEYANTYLYPLSVSSIVCS